jgi:hypothetical protein
MSLTNPAKQPGVFRSSEKGSTQMPEKPEIEKIRVLHDLHTQFDVPEAVRNTLHSQLKPGSQEQIDRFMSGFKIEDWFEWIFCPMPWVRLIHGLDQQQFPQRSKESYQVPDFLIIVETSARTHQPLLVEVKRVPQEKETLKLQESQVTLCQQYASAVNIPLVYVVYWDRLSAWTMNTVDTFDTKASSRKLTMPKAFELDCSAILGDISHLIPNSLVRLSRFTTRDVVPNCVQHRKYGRLLSDALVLGDKRIEMSSVESAAIDSMLAMKLRSENDVGEDVTELIEATDELYLLKLSSWITRHLGLFRTEPSERYSNMSAHVITDLMKKLDCPVMHLFPTNRTEDLRRIDSLFRSYAPPANDETT